MKKLLLLLIASSSISLMGMGMDQQKQIIPMAQTNSTTELSPTNIEVPNPSNCCTPNGKGSEAPCVDYVGSCLLTSFFVPADVLMCPTIACYRITPSPSNDFCNQGDNLCNERPPISYCCLTAIIWGWDQNEGCKRILSCGLPSNETRRRIWSCNMK